MSVSTIVFYLKERIRSVWQRYDPVGRAAAAAVVVVFFPAVGAGAATNSSEPTDSFHFPFAEKEDDDDEGTSIAGVAVSSPRMTTEAPGLGKGASSGSST